MGRIKTTLVKRVTIKVIEKHSEKLKKDFNKNKKIIETLVDFPSKKIRNIVAGYATRLMKTKE